MTAIFDLVPSGDVVVDRWTPGTVLFSEGETPRGVYMLYSGQVDLIFSARNGSVKPLRVAKAGQILGLTSVVSGKHDCTAVARTSCLTGFVTREAFRRALDQTPALWFAVLSVLSNDVGAVYDDMRELASRCAVATRVSGDQQRSRPAAAASPFRPAVHRRHE